MSNPYSDIIQLYSTSLISSYCGLAGFVMVFYEYFVTFGDEVDLFWRRKISSASVIFFLNRYLTLLGYVLDSGTFHAQTDIGFASTGFYLLRYFPQAAFSSLRAYALCEYNRWIAGVVFLLLTGPVAVNASTLRWTHIRNLPAPIGCTSSADISPSLAKNAIGADFLVVMVTWWKTRKSMKLYREANIKASYASLMLRDGTVYFLVLLILNVLHMVLTILAYTEAFISVSYVSIFTDPIMSILVSRFLLDLRQVDHTGVNAVGSELPSFVAPQGGAFSEYASFVAPLGTQLVPHGDDNTVSEGPEGNLDSGSGDLDGSERLADGASTSSDAHLTVGGERGHWDASERISSRSGSSASTYMTARTEELLSVA
ncbi:hypothetical protein C8Q73DRAFT_789525 [Cubamyces lactineus]|nr:hypothetical protein C8Q73DRAFT_789525 [Cubamyces lactineus]